MKVRRFEGIESLSKFLGKEESGEILVKKVTVIPHIPDIFYVFYDEDKSGEDIMSKIIDFRNFLVREEMAFETLIRSVKKEKLYWENCDYSISKRIIDYFTWLEGQLAMSAIAVNEMMRETKKMLVRRH